MNNPHSNLKTGLRFGKRNEPIRSFESVVIGRVSPRETMFCPRTVFILNVLIHVVYRYLLMKYEFLFVSKTLIYSAKFSKCFQAKIKNGARMQLY